MVDPTSWTHPEPVTADLTLRASLQAGVADPLWLLARQMGFGELSGQDRGSPVAVQIDADTAELTRMAADPSAGGAAVTIDTAQVPLEAMLEASPEPTPRPTAPGEREGAARPLPAARLGLHYLRLLRASGLTDLDQYRRALIDTYPLPPAYGGEGPPPADYDSPILRLFVEKTPDAQALYADLAGLRSDPPAVATEHPLPAGGINAILGSATAWLDFYDQVAGCPGGLEATSEDAWDPQRFEYQVSLSAPGPGAETILTAVEHTAGHLDWYQFDLGASARYVPPTSVSLGAIPDADATEQLHISAIPTPVRYRSMPSSRFWEFEDAAVNFGDLDEPAEAILTAVIIEYALRYGSDHQLVPLPLKLGSLCRINRLVATTTFGERILVRPVADLEPHGPFRLFEHSFAAGDAPAEPGRDPLFILFPTVEQPLTSQPIETVHLLRDEPAELVWAVEHTVLGPTGQPIDRAASSAAPPPVAHPTGAAKDTDRDYLLRTDVESNWFPYLSADPNFADNPSQLQLATLEPIQPGVSPPRPWSDTLIRSEKIQQEEVTRAGLHVNRVWRYARWSNGNQVTWVARTVQPGAGPGVSGLLYDLALPPATDTT